MGGINGSGGAFELIAHRGASGYAPENTVAAFSKAFEMGSSAIELDVQQTRDGVLVVAHDPDLNRVAGVRRKIAAMPYAELSRLDVGKWFDPRFAGERVPRLEEVFGAAGRLGAGRVQIHVEIKDGARPYAGIEDRLVAFLDCRPEWKPRVIVSSFDHDALRRIRAAAPRLRLGYLVGWTRRPKALREAVELGCESVHLGLRQVDRAWVREIHARGMRVLVYTVNRAARARELAAIQVDGVFTNFPDLLRGAARLREAARA